MIDEKVLLSYIQQNRRTKIMSWDKRSGGYNSAMDAVEEFINKMPKTDPIILKPNDEENRTNSVTLNSRGISIKCTSKICTGERWKDKTFYRG